MISVLILTRNEQQDLPACLASVAWSDDIHIFDSHSTDSTVAIAAAAGAHVHQRAFDDYATHRNAALRDIPFQHPWLFLLDADERPTPALTAEMLGTIVCAPENASAATASDVATSSLAPGSNTPRSRPFTSASSVRNAPVTPAPSMRSWKSKAKSETLQPRLDHFPFSKGIAHWVTKHNLYSTMEAELIDHQQGLQHPSLTAALTGPDFHHRRQHQKAIFYRLPFRPVLKFLYMVFIRGAWLDGRAGIMYAALQSFYEYLIVIKTKELADFRRGSR